MAGAAGVRKALKTFLNSWKGNKSAKLTLTSVKGDLSVVLELKLGQYCESERRVEGRGYQGLHGRQVGPSQLRRRERRAADPVIQQRAAAHAASAQTGPALPPVSVAAEEAVTAAAAQVAASAEEAASDSAQHAVAAGQAVPAAGQAAPAGQTVAPVHTGAPRPTPYVPVPAPPLPTPPLEIAPTLPPLSTPPCSSPPPQQCPVKTTLPPPPAEKPPLPPAVPNYLPPTVTSPFLPPSTPSLPKAKKSRPHTARSLDLDPHSQVECPVCYKLIQPRLMANHAKYFHVNSDLGVECPKCEV